ncbi:MAG: hypothetical protein HY225_00865 [Candidatus Vogelbacteria bacterium]|nr:hypothetical protein [Candidatus Vogelbacteria bacterium]
MKGTILSREQLAQAVLEFPYILKSGLSVPNNIRRKRAARVEIAKHSPGFRIYVDGEQIPIDLNKVDCVIHQRGALIRLYFEKMPNDKTPVIVSMESPEKAASNRTANFQLEQTNKIKRRAQMEESHRRFVSVQDAAVSEKILEALAGSSLDCSVSGGEATLSSENGSVKLPINSMGDMKVSVFLGGEKVAIEFEKVFVETGCDCCDGHTDYRIKINNKLIAEY